MDKRPFRCGFIFGAGVMLLLTIAALAWLVHRVGKSQQTPPLPDPVIRAQGPAVGDAALVEVLKPIRLKYKLPALAGAIVKSDGGIRLGAVGVRKAGTDVAVTLDDKWHLGSDTKAMTATVVASLVEQGKLTWETTLAEVFPDLASRFHPIFKKATIRQLLTHQAGFSENLDWGKIAKQGTIPEQRIQSLILATSAKPQYELGGKTHYSNLGYVVAGAVIERITGHSWEDAIRELLFDPLKMTTVGFGGMGTPGKLDQPWPHRAKAEPTSGNGPAVDNPPVMGPAGCVHCSLADWGKFIADHLRGARGSPALLKPESYAALHTPPAGNNYALGWLVTQRDWGGGTVLTHAGCNTMNFANVWIAPQRDFAVLVCINQGDDVAAKASDEAIGALIRFCKVE
ncbi:MAG: class A beta-lactamase-related serine hydrolase [Verrucomicrobia bacterium]|nr:MAG: class A beta-lactamase-related serine hydrolase [Verrucomicrobiota bacterium]